MEVYLIRHGETGGNVAHRHQAEKTPLTEHGKEQARKVAEEVKGLKPTHLISSPVIRAVETARIIGDVCNLVPDTNPHFKELIRPQHLYGNYHKSLPSMYYYARWFFGYTNEGESYEALRNRIKFAKEHFRDYPEDARVAVVTHSVFINMFLAHLCDDDPINAFEAVQTFIGILSLENTTLVPLIFDPEAYADTCGWIRPKV